MDIHPGVTGSILIAERDIRMRELQEHFLTAAGFDPEFVDDGEAALERARTILPVGVITEILLPKVDGLSLCRQLRADPLTRHIPVLVFSILAAQLRAEEAGATAFLRKPLEDATFIASVQRMIKPQTTEGTEQQWQSR